MAAETQLRDISALLAACRAGDAEAWRAFVALSQPVLARACLRAARAWGRHDPAAIEDFVQDCYARLAASKWLVSFEVYGPESLFAFLRLLAARVVNDQCKAMTAVKRGGKVQEFPLELAPEPSLRDRAPGDVLFAQLETLVREASSGQTVDRDLLVFQLYYRLGLTAAAIAAIPSLGLSVKGVESALHRLASLVRERLARAGVQERSAHGD